MDFITRLPKVRDKTVFLVIIDSLSKHAHFAALSTHFTAQTVVETFVYHVAKLHGFPTVIVSDRDPVFMSPF